MNYNLFMKCVDGKKLYILNLIGIEILWQHIFKITIDANQNTL